MNKIDVLELENGEKIGIEVALPPGRANEVLVSAQGDRQSIAFSKALDRIRPMTERLLATLRDIGDSPKSVEVTFGLKLSADLGVIVASGSTEANFEVKLVWEKDAPAAGG